MPDAPNVVFVITDDQGSPPMGCHGHPFIQTPNLDRLHSQSARFTQFHSGPTCAPTRAGLMTGHHSNSTGVWHTIGGRSLLRRDEWTLPSALREAGYRTGHFGKWHLGDNFPYRPQDRGFDDVVCHGGGGISQQTDWWGNDYFDDTYMVDGEPKAFKGYCTDVFFDEGLDFIHRHKDQPFFCYISTNAPHGPFNVSPAYRDRYTEYTDSENYARFLGMITNIDDNVGRLNSALEEWGLADNTIVIFMSDNGQTGVGPNPEGMYTAGLRGLKGSPYEGGHRIPFFMRWTAGGIGTQGDIPALAGHIDFMPTLLELCGVAVPDERRFHGRSLVPLLRGESSPDWDERVLVTDSQREAHPVKWRLSATMQGPWRLVNGRELYKLDDDPGQATDIAVAHPERVQAMRSAYEDWWDVCAEGMDKEVPISIGGDEEETCLHTHDLRAIPSESTVWNQGQVRQGRACTGYWELFVEQPGTYAFELRRWPREAGYALTHGFEGSDMGYDEEGVAPDGLRWYLDGKALSIETATLLISNGIRASVDVEESATSAVVTVELEAGPAHLQGIFSSGDGLYTSAYYIYAKRVS